MACTIYSHLQGRTTVRSIREKAGRAISDDAGVLDVEVAEGRVGVCRLDAEDHAGHERL